MSTDKKVTLATWLGGSAEHIIDGETLVYGVQREVPAGLAKRLEREYPAQAVVVHTTEGSKLDERTPDYVVPPQPDEEPVGDDWPVADEPKDVEAGAADPKDHAGSLASEVHHSTPHDTPPKAEE